MKLAPDSLTNWIQLTFTLVGGIYALYLLRQSHKDKRNQYVVEILNRLYNDKEIRAIIYCVDSGRNVNEIRYGGELEQEADKTIQYFDYVGYLIKEGNLKSEDIKPFEYEITRILTNEVVCTYIDWLRGIGVALQHLSYLRGDKSRKFQ
jgi:hypothetical protein